MRFPVACRGLNCVSLCSSFIFANFLIIIISVVLCSAYVAAGGPVRRIMSVPVTEAGALPLTGRKLEPKPVKLSRAHFPFPGKCARFLPVCTLVRRFGPKDSARAVLGAAWAHRVRVSIGRYCVMGLQARFLPRTSVPPRPEYQSRQDLPPQRKGST